MHKYLALLSCKMGLTLPFELLTANNLNSGRRDIGCILSSHEKQLI
jgi:hypothetical protein